MRALTIRFTKANKNNRDLYPTNHQQEAIMQSIDNISFNSRTAVPELLELAKAELPNLHEGESFLLSDLFYGYIWKRIPAKDRKLLGRFFLDFADSKEGKKVIEVLSGTLKTPLLYVRK